MRGCRDLTSAYRLTRRYFIQRNIFLRVKLCKMFYSAFIVVCGGARWDWKLLPAAKLEFLNHSSLEANKSINFGQLANCFRSQSGHKHNFDRSIRREAISSAQQPLITSHRLFNDSETRHQFPCFRPSLAHDGVGGKLIYASTSNNISHTPVCSNRYKWCWQFILHSSEAIACCRVTCWFCLRSL